LWPGLPVHWVRVRVCVCVYAGGWAHARMNIPSCVCVLACITMSGQALCSAMSGHALCSAMSGQALCSAMSDHAVLYHERPCFVLYHDRPSFVLCHERPCFVLCHERSTLRCACWVSLSGCQLGSWCADTGKGSIALLQEKAPLRCYGKRLHCAVTGKGSIALPLTLSCRQLLHGSMPMWRVIRGAGAGGGLFVCGATAPTPTTVCEHRPEQLKSLGGAHRWCRQQGFIQFLGRATPIANHQAVCGGASGSAPPTPHHRVCARARAAQAKHASCAVSCTSTHAPPLARASLPHLPALLAC